AFGFLLRLASPVSRQRSGLVVTFGEATPGAAPDVTLVAAWRDQFALRRGLAAPGRLRRGLCFCRGLRLRLWLRLRLRLAPRRRLRGLSRLRPGTGRRGLRFALCLGHEVLLSVPVHCTRLFD